MNYKFILIDVATGNDQLTWILPPPVIVGRGSEAEVSIGDPSISRRHCQFLNDADGALIIRDLDSMNGTYVDEVRITKTVLRPGSLVRIGALTLRIEWTSEAPTVRPKPGSTRDAGTTQPMQILKRRRDGE